MILTIVFVVVAVGGTFATTWWTLRQMERRTQERITQMQSEAWRSWTDEWDGES